MKRIQKFVGNFSKGTQRKHFLQWMFDTMYFLCIKDDEVSVGELYQTMEHVFTNPLLGPTCFAIHLPERFRVQQARAGVTTQALAGNDTPYALPTWSTHKNVCELEYLCRLKVAAAGNVTEAARLSGISRTRLYQLSEKHGVDFS